MTKTLPEFKVETEIEETIRLLFRTYSGYVKDGDMIRASICRQEIDKWLDIAAKQVQITIKQPGITPQMIANMPPTPDEEAEPTTGEGEEQEPVGDVQFESPTVHQRWFLKKHLKYDNTKLATVTKHDAWEIIRDFKQAESQRVNDMLKNGETVKRGRGRPRKTI